MTAVRAGRGQLKLILWGVVAADDVAFDDPAKWSFIRYGDNGDVGADASHIGVKQWETWSATGWLTAHRGGTGILQMTTWLWNRPHIIKGADSGLSGGRADLIALKPLGDNLTRAPFTRYCYTTAVRNAAGRLQLISWALLSEDGKAIGRIGDSGDPGEEAIDRLAMDGPVTAVRTAEGNLKLISWSLADGVIERLGDSGDQGGPVTEIAIAWYSPTRYVTATIGGDGGLRLIAWDLSPQGDLVRTGDSGQIFIPATEVALKTNPVAPPDAPNIATAIRSTQGGQLVVIDWRMDERPGIGDRPVWVGTGGPTSDLWR